MGQTDITFDENFKDLPIELKNVVISNIPIKNLISRDDTSVEPIIDTFIKNYINTQLLSDASTFTYLKQSKLYNEIITKKIGDMAANYSHDFIQHCKIFDAKPESERKNSFVYFNIRYNHGTDYNYKFIHKLNNKPLMSSLRYESGNNYLTLNRDNSIRSLMQDEKYISSEIYSALYHLMDNFRNIYQVHSIEITETTYNEENHYTDVLDSYSGDCKVIKKYY